MPHVFDSPSPGGAPGATPAEDDLESLAWVLEEIRAALGRAGQALRRVARVARAGFQEVAAAAPRPAVHELHQVAGALRMVHRAAPARLVAAMEAVARAWSAGAGGARGVGGTEAQADTIERAGRAVVDHLESLLAGRPMPGDALLAHQREVDALLEAVDASSPGPRDGAPPRPRFADGARPARSGEAVGPSLADVREQLGDIERALDRFYRRPENKAPLRRLPAQLDTLGEAFSGLGLDEATRAARHMRDDVQRLLADGAAHGEDDALPPGIDALGNNLGAFGLLVDMLGYQPGLARRAFVFDAASGELRAVADAGSGSGASAGGAGPSGVAGLAGVPDPARMARSGAPADGGDPMPSQERGRPDRMAAPERDAAAGVVPDTPQAVSVEPEPGGEDAELLGIFLDEAREVLRGAAEVVLALERDPADTARMTALRRAFHTLKGSARMVGLAEPAEAAAAFEQLLNTWLADQRGATPELLGVVGRALRDLSDWVEAIGAGRPHAWRAGDFRRAADALRGAGEADAAPPQAAMAPRTAPHRSARERAARMRPADGDSDDAPEADDDGFRMVGPLRIGAQLHDVYLAEADEWSGQLASEIAEWAREPRRLIAASTVALAHSLIGSSATVGLQGLSSLARCMEAALRELRRQGQGTPRQATAMAEAAEELRQLLHQFAAGILREPSRATLQALDDIAGALAGAKLVPPAAARRLPGPPHEDGLDATDAVDAELFPVFEEEAIELLHLLGAALREWARQPGDSTPGAAALRALHTLKGGARLAGAMRLGEIAHRMESSIEAAGRQRDPIGPMEIEELFERFDALQSQLDHLRAAGGGAAPPTRPAATPGPDTALAADAASAAPHPGGAGQTVRIRTQLLDRMVAQAGEVVVTRSRLVGGLAQMRASLGELTGNLDRLRQQLRDVELQAESQMQSRLAQAKDSQQGFDPLEFDRFTRVQELTRMMAESVDDVATVQRALHKSLQAGEDALGSQARQTRELQRDLLRTRMVEFESIAERLYGVVRQAARDTGRQVRLDISGGSVEIDRGVLERMTPAFEHLLRNAVAHGIEDARAREWAGKNATGLIAIELHQEGNDVAVSFRDDGAGLDVERIADRARALGLLGAQARITPGEAAEFIFRPGFSTAGQISELSGRGIGMDVVRTSVAALGGRIETDTTAGAGTRFTLVLPLTTAVTHVVMLRAGGMTIGVPANLVELVQRASADDLAAAYGARHHAFAGEDVPFYWAGALLQSSPRSDQFAVRTHFIVIVRSVSRRVALHVDEVQGNQEVVVRNLGPQLSRLAGMAAASVLSSGAVALIYNPVALADVHGEEAWRLQARDSIPALAADVGAARPGAAPLVLVVDDSLTVRRVTQRLLQREGFRVALAADGLQALEMLQQEIPSVVLSDIEMPRMDGFDLARNIRSEPTLAHLPIIMITSRIAAKHREHAMRLGVNHYLGKPYAEDELVALIRECAKA